MITVSIIALIALVIGLSIIAAKTIKRKPTVFDHDINAIRRNIQTATCYAELRAAKMSILWLSQKHANEKDIDMVCDDLEKERGLAFQMLRPAEEIETEYQQYFNP